MNTLLISLISFFTLSIIITLLVAFLLRRVVPTNEVHIVQSSKKTTSYGKEQGQNTYYEFPSWVPIVGITKTILPVSVFDLDLRGYEAYDKGRLPFLTEIKAFFRIDDSNLTAQRISSFEELKEQLLAIVQGAVRTILAKYDIEQIMQERAKFGEEFTKEIEKELTSWGVVSVKNLELMDIRDQQNINVIRNITEKKKSLIDKESRIEVAKNTQLAKAAEIEASKKTELLTQEAQQEIGQRQALTKKEIGISEQKTLQDIKEQEKVTKEKEMEIVRVEEVKRAEIQKDKQVVEANQQKETNITLAEGVKQQTILEAEAKLQAQKLNAEGIKVEGEAKATAEDAMQLALIKGQVTLADKVGNNEGYQNYLATVRKIEAVQIIGVEQAKAIKDADIKIIANGGSVEQGVNKIGDILSARGGLQLSSALESFNQTEVGRSLIESFISLGSSQKRDKESSQK
jgi:flotillin